MNRIYITSSECFVDIRRGDAHPAMAGAILATGDAEKDISMGYQWDVSVAGLDCFGGTSKEVPFFSYSQLSGISGKSTV